MLKPVEVPGVTIHKQSLTSHLSAPVCAGEIDIRRETVSIYKEYMLAHVLYFIKSIYLNINQAN